ncbi:MAG: peptidoglycan bridge formation glycyltransferase FemA/FemB family protein, partial [Candidatus Aminicenantes bacterium]|nr:peptidoglycan bridge formation glycyltransferase FemA/FemB family protein [Candidatus Aminicenantes bacterium]
LKSKSIYIEFRNFNDYGKYKKIFKKHGYEFKSHLNFHVDCSSEAEMFKRISSSKRRQIKNSLKNGAEIIIAKSESEIAQFYDMLKLLYKEKVKKPLPPKEYFINFFRNPVLGKYFLIKYMNKIIGGIMCPILDNRVIYEAYVVGEDRKFKNIYPSILATYAAMDYAAKNGIKIFDFMGAGSADQSYGVREFKSKFGGELNYFGRFERINNRILFIFGRFGLKFYRGIKN